MNTFVPGGALRPLLPVIAGSPRGARETVARGAKTAVSVCQLAAVGEWGVKGGQRWNRPRWNDREGGATLTRHTLRSSFWLLMIARGALAQSLHAQTPAGSVGVKTYTGFYN